MVAIVTKAPLAKVTVTYNSHKKSTMLENFFSVISIFYAFRGLQLAAIVVRDWANLRGPTFTPQSKSLASQASFYLAVPVGVFFHELSHALAIWLFGGQVTQFAYRVFWGFVVPDRFFAPNQEWFISLAGTLGSLIFGLVIWLAFMNNASPTLRFFGLRAFRYQIFFSLVYYPVFTLLGFYGDWRAIYDFNATPMLSGATAVIHAGLLLWFWQADRSGFFEMGAFGSPEVEKKITALEDKAAASPFDTNLQLQLIAAYQQSGMNNKAKLLNQKFLKENPNSAEGYLQMAYLEEAGKQEIPTKAKDHAAKALSLGLNKPAATASAHQIIGRYFLGVNKQADAIDQFNQGIGAVKTADNQDLYINLLYFRALAYRRQQQYDAAFQDVQQAIQMARNGRKENALAFLNKELETLANHSGRSPEQFKIPPNP
jgi:tetratricopeptide (TPR) repeat protein